MNQRSDRMTSTSFNVGLGDGSRSSSRVLRPPGGGHTDIFGGDPEPPRGRRAGPPAVPSSIGQIDEVKPTNGTVKEANIQNGQNHEAPQETKSEPITTPEPVPTAQPAQETKQQNVSKETEAKTEPIIEASKPEAGKMEPPKRVRVPPGGFSSGLW